jgi:hypothetical protein
MTTDFPAQGSCRVDQKPWFVAGPIIHQIGGRINRGTDAGGRQRRVVAAFAACPIHVAVVILNEVKDLAGHRHQ